MMFYDARTKPKSVHGQWIWVCKKCETPINHASADFIGDKSGYYFGCDCWTFEKLSDEIFEEYKDIWSELAKK